MGDDSGLKRVSSKEQTNQGGGKSGGGTPTKGSVVGAVRTNATKGGGINRATKSN